MPELNSLIASILPYALGAAVSPVILATLLTTVSPTRSPRLASFSYLFGSIIFFLIVAFSGMYIGSVGAIISLNVYITDFAANLLIYPLIIASQGRFMGLIYLERFQSSD